MFRRLSIALLAFIVAATAAAQVASPDYAIRNIRSRFTDGGRQTLVEFEVWNIGAEASVTATASLRVIATGQEVAIDTVPPLQAQEIITVSLTFPTSTFPLSSVQSLRVSVGVDEVEMSGSQTIQNNFAQISVTVPADVLPPEGTPEPQPGGTGAGGDLENQAAAFLRQFGIRLDLSNPTQVLVLAGICVASLFALIIVIVLLRLLLKRPPDTGNWQPTYVNYLPLDPNSVAGRRHQWQTHAQSNSVPPYCSDGAFHVRKLAMDGNGGYLAGWRVDAVRLGLYDRYGRIARSQAVAKSGAVRRLDAALRARPRLDHMTLDKRLRPVAKMLVNDFKRQWNERNAMLPIALDIRLRGKPGEVRILFELYQCVGGAWQLADQWEPEMTAGKRIHETYTFTLYGQRPGETPRSFRARLADDLVGVLAEMIALPPPAPPPAEPPRPPTPTDPHLKAVSAG